MYIIADISVIKNLHTFLNIQMMKGLTIEI